MLKAAWEAKTDKVIVKNIARDRIAAIRKRTETDLASRKAKLAAILANEDKMYE